MYVPSSGAYIISRNVKKNTFIPTEYINLSKLYNVRHFFENENWQAVFPPSTLNAEIMSRIANANYATIVNACDSSIMFVYRQDGGKEPDNLIFAFQRGDVKNGPCGGAQ